MMVKCWILFDVLHNIGKSFLESLSQNTWVFKDVFYVQLSTVKGRPPPPPQILRTCEPPKICTIATPRWYHHEWGIFPHYSPKKSEGLNQHLIGGWWWLEAFPYEGLQPRRLALGAWGPSIPIVFRKCRDGLKIPILGIYIPTLRDKLRWLAGKWTLNESMYIIISYWKWGYSIAMLIYQRVRIPYVSGGMTIPKIEFLRCDHWRGDPPMISWCCGAPKGKGWDHVGMGDMNICHVSIYVY